MLPNQTSVTLQEILNLGKKIKEVFGNYDITSVHFANFLQDEKVTKMLLVISFEDANMDMDIRDFCIIYKNNWDELFVRRFPSVEKLKSFFIKTGRTSSNLETNYYIQRNNKYYEKIIQRTKNMIAQMLTIN
jgi:adenylate cyclase class 1